jgi:hypothetical protein
VRLVQTYAKRRELDSNENNRLVFLSSSNEVSSVSDADESDLMMVMDRKVTPILACGCNTTPSPYLQ